jgi:hypothetical protein
MISPTDLPSFRLPITPGPEMTALARFFPDVSWLGSINPGGIGPGSPENT